MNDDLRRVAFNLLLEKSFSRGQFKLASGKMSNYYFDAKPTMFDPAGALALAKLVLDRLQGYDIQMVGGLEMGAVPLISNVAMISEIMRRPLPGFFVRKQVKDHGTKRLVEGSPNVSGKRVAILDDVTTTGESAMIAVRAAQEAGANVVLVLSVVDREEGAAAFYEKQGIPFAWLFTSGEFLRATEPAAANGP
jgi:orotate phosphoribosyltransferase